MSRPSQSSPLRRRLELLARAERDDFVVIEDDHESELNFSGQPTPAELIRELRALRRLMMRHVPTNNQQVAASFIAHGHQEAFVRRMNIATATVRWRCVRRGRSTRRAWCRCRPTAARRCG